MTLRIGLVKWAEKPASKLWAANSAKACAVRAIMGMGRLPDSRSKARIARVAA